MEKKEFKEQFVLMVYGRFGRYADFEGGAAELTELVEEYLGLDYQENDGEWTLNDEK